MASTHGQHPRPPPMPTTHAHHPRPPPKTSTHAHHPPDASSVRRWARVRACATVFPTARAI
eukprot:2941321-Prymnesium_polylepis.1